MQAKILNGVRKGQTGDVITAINSEGDESIVVEFKDGLVDTFDFHEVEVKAVEVD